MRVWEVMARRKKQSEKQQGRRERERDGGCGGRKKDDGWQARRGRLLCSTKLISRQMFLSAVKNGTALSASHLSTTYSFFFFLLLVSSLISVPPIPHIQPPSKALNHTTAIPLLLSDLSLSAISHPASMNTARDYYYFSPVTHSSLGSSEKEREKRPPSIAARDSCYRRPKAIPKVSVYDYFSPTNGIKVLGKGSNLSRSICSFNPAADFGSHIKEIFFPHPPEKCNPVKVGRENQGERCRSERCERCIKCRGY